MSIALYYWFLGIIVGIALSVIFVNIKNRHLKITGLIEVDIQSNLCKFHINGPELSNIKTKKVIFNVIHRSRSFARRTYSLMRT